MSTTGTTTFFTIFFYMSKAYRFSLDKRRGRAYIHECPECRRREFRRYVDNETMEYIADHVGRCNRQVECGNHYPPRKHFERTKCYNTPATWTKPKKEVERPCGYLDIKYVEDSLKRMRWDNTFTNWIYQFISHYPNRDEILMTILDKYYLGGSDKMKGAVVFWQVDIAGKVRTGKIMQYNPETGKRIKDPNNQYKINWVHFHLQREKIIDRDFNLKQCFFGEHLLANYPDATVAVFESEKTAVVASILFPDMVCLASGGLSGLNDEKCKVLRNRNVIFFPDLKCLSLWEEKVKAISKTVSFANYSINIETGKNKNGVTVSRKRYSK